MARNAVEEVALPEMRADRTTPTRRAVTLVELLVVMAMIGVLAGLLLPAVQAAREAGRRAQCANHLKQLTLGCLLHEQTYKHFPTGGWGWYWSGDPDRGFDRRQPGGWTYTVLPFIEQQALYELGARQTPAVRRSDYARRHGVPVVVFYCPTRRSPMTYPNLYNTCDSDPVSQSARTDYAANSGTGLNCWWAPPPGGDPAFTDAPNFPWPWFDGDGVIYSLSTVTGASIADGASNTYLLGEKYLNSDNYQNGADGADDNPLYCGFDWDWQRWASTRPVRDRRGVSDYQSFGSAHSSGLNMALCDGSVRFVDYNISAETQFRLGSRRDGQPVSLE